MEPTDPILVNNDHKDAADGASELRGVSESSTKHEVAAKFGFVNVHLLVSPEDPEHLKEVKRVLKHGAPASGAASSSSLARQELSKRNVNLLAELGLEGVSRCSI